MVKKVLWVSRHRPLNAELRFIKEKLGDYELKIWDKKVPSAEWLINHLIIPEKIDIVIPVLPLSIIARLSELSERYGYEIWFAEMELLHNDKVFPCEEYNADTDTVVDGIDIDGNRIYRHYRFKTFKRILRIGFDLEDID